MYGSHSYHAFAGPLVVDLVRVIVEIKPSVAFFEDLAAEGLLGVEDCAEEGGAFDGVVLVDDEE